MFYGSNYSLYVYWFVPLSDSLAQLGKGVGEVVEKLIPYSGDKKLLFATFVKHQECVFVVTEGIFLRIFLKCDRNVLKIRKFLQLFPALKLKIVINIHKINNSNKFNQTKKEKITKILK